MNSVMFKVVVIYRSASDESTIMAARQYLKRFGIELEFTVGMEEPVYMMIENNETEAA